MQDEKVIFSWDTPEVEVKEAVEETVEKTETEEKVEAELPADPIEEEEQETQESEEETEEEEEEAPEGEPLESPITQEDVVKATLSDLVTLGLANDEEVKDVTAETFYPFLQNIIDKNTDAAIASSLEELTPRERQAVQYILSGGTLSELVEKVSVPNFDVSTDKGAVDFLRQYHKAEGLSDEEIEDKLDFYESRENAKTYAEKYFKKWKDAQEQIEEQEFQKPIQSKEQQRKKRKEWEQSILGSTKAVDEYAGIKFDSNTKKSLINDILMNTVKTEQGTYTSGFIDKFFKVYQGGSPEKLMLIAKILQEDFDPTIFERTAETKGTREVKTKLQKLAQTKPVQGGATKKAQPVWEQFK